MLDRNINVRRGKVNWVNKLCHWKYKWKRHFCSGFNRMYKDCNFILVDEKNLWFFDEMNLHVFVSYNYSSIISNKHKSTSSLYIAIYKILCKIMRIAFLINGIWYHINIATWSTLLVISTKEYSLVVLNFFDKFSVRTWLSFT